MLTRPTRRTLSAGGFAYAAVFAALFLQLTAWDALAQDTARDWNDPVDTLEGAIGLHYGKIGGHGLSFRLPLRWWLYLQPSGGLWHSNDRKQHNFGFQFHYILRQDQRLRLFLSAGTGYFHDNQRDGAGVWHKDSNWNYGGGVGLEILQGRRWSWQIEGDFIHHGNSGDINITPQVGIYYYW